MLWQHFNRDASIQFRPTQRFAACMLLELLLDEPLQLKKHLKLYVHSIFNISTTD